MSVWWTAAELKDAIERCELECELMIRNGATPETLYCRRANIDHLYELLAEAERQEA